MSKSNGESVTNLNGIYAKISAPINVNGGCLHKTKSVNLIKKNVAKKMLRSAKGRGKTIVIDASKPGELPPFGLIFLKSAN